MKFIIDRIEGDLAVLTIPEWPSLELNLPLEYLPSGARAGDHVKAEFTLDPVSRTDAETTAQDLLNDLTKDNDPSQTKFKL